MKMIDRTGGRRILAVVAALTLGAGAGAALAAGPAQAVEKRSAVPQRQHCVMDVTGRTPMTCYRSFTEAISRATGGRVADAPASTFAASRDAAFDARLNAAAVESSRVGTQADTVISIEYMERDFGGAAQIWSANNGCNNSLNNVDHESPTVNWAVNQISSFRSYAECWVKHYENPSYGGASIGYEPTRSYIGAAMDNRTSSIRWT